MAEFPTYEQMAKNVAEKALDEFLYDGKSIREWMKIIVEQEPKTGHWREDIDNNRKWDRVRFYCSECGNWQTYGKTHYCPNCGAKMEEEE